MLTFTRMGRTTDDAFTPSAHTVASIHALVYVSNNSARGASWHEACGSALGNLVRWNAALHFRPLLHVGMQRE